MSLPRGIRNNNAGNIRWSKDNWQGLMPKDGRDDPSFCQFKAAVYGLRALVVILLTYLDKYGLDTIESIINRYAPPNENDTEAYIMRVSNKLGVAPDEPIELTDKVLLELVKAIVGVENGNSYYDYYPDELINEAIKMARSRR